MQRVPLGRGLDDEAAVTVHGRVERQLTAAKVDRRPPEQWPITPTLPLELLNPRR